MHHRGRRRVWSALPDKQIAQNSLPRWPRPEAGLDIDMSHRTDVHEISVPRLGEFAGSRQRDVRIVGTCYHDAPEWQRSARDRSETANMIGRVVTRLDIGRCDQQSSRDSKLRSFSGKMRYQGTAQAVCEYPGNELTVILKIAMPAQGRRLTENQFDIS
jgi:hypothetical protein